MTGPVPRLALWLVRRGVGSTLAEDVLGDLEEAWQTTRAPRPVAWITCVRMAAAVYWHGRRERVGPASFHDRQSLAAAALQDARLAARLLARQPRMSVAAILTLAIGIGASTTMLTATRTVVVPSLPYPDASRLMHIWATWPGGSGNFSYPDFEAIRAEAPAFDSVAAYESWGSIALGTGDRPVHLNPVFVSPQYFSTLGATAAIGRLFGPADHAAGAGGVAIISHGLWLREFGGDSGTVGRSVSLNGTPYTIIGVLRAGFADLGQAEEPPADVWLPTTAAQPLLGQAPLTEVSRIFWGVGHLAPGANVALAQQQLDAVADRLAAARPATHKGYRLNGKPLHEYLHGAISTPARLLVAGSLLMLLIGCANVANLMLARAAERRGEFALRVAIGASRGRMLRQALVESLVLAAAGGAIGMAIAIGLTAALAPWIETRVSPFVNLRGDAAAFAISAALTMVTSVVVGMAPALAAARADLREAANLTGRSSASLVRHRLRAALVVAEVSLAVVLLVGAGLFIRSVQRLMSSGLGFPTDRLITFRLDLSGARYDQGAARAQFAQDFVRVAQAVPGVESATIWGPSMLGRATWVTNILPEGRPADRRDAFVMAFFHATNPGGLHNLGIPLVAGREFTPFDRSGSAPVVVISQGLAREFWSDGGGVGRRLQRENPNQPMWTVIGIARDAQHRERYSLLGIAEGFGPSGLEAQRDVYLPYAQRPANAMTVAVRAIDPDRATAPLRDAIATLDPGLAIDDVRTLDDRLAEQNSAPAAVAALLGAYAAMALLLAGVGLYSVIAHAVQERTYEIGVRLALGARAATVLGLVARQGAGLVAMGLVIGLAAAATVARLVRSLLYGVAATDVVTFAGVPALLAVIALVAMWAPILRATRIDPIVALREP